MDSKVFAGKYQVERELGQTGTGRTFLAVGPDDERVVVKVVHPVDAAAATVDEHDVDLISGIQDPALPTIFEWGHDGPDFFVVREYVPGADLERELGQQGSFAPLTAARYATQAADALAQIHRRGLVHGNVKTASLIQTTEDEIKLVGNSLGLAGPAVSPGAPPSAAYYLAPEQAEGGAPTSPATDVYAMGVVLYELIAGHVPFDGPTVASVLGQQAHSVPAPIGETAEELPAALEAVIMRALEKAPEARFADGDALRAALQDAVSGPKKVAPASVVAPRKRSVWPWVTAGVVVVAAALIVAWALGAFGTSEIAVPGVVGMTQSQASAAILAAGLQVGNVTFAGAPVAGVTDGSVSSESPAQGIKVDLSSKVDLVLAGAETVQVPDVVGLTEAQATVALQNAGLVSGTVSQVATAAVAAGTVATQSPLAGSTVNKGASVDLQVAESPATPAVPDVTRQTQAHATAILQNAGFVVSVVQASSASVPSGQVIEQNPTAGVTARTGSTVTVTVSTGPALVAVPDVIGATQADAVNMLTAAGFASHVTLHTGGGPVGTVIGQSPAAGVKAAGGSTVVITVAQ
jgi:beta-lactam-binding protein with PASTA domain